MAMAALRNAARKLASQRPPAIHRAAATEVPRRLFQGGSSPVGRNFSLAEEQRRLLPRLMHGGSPVAGRTYSRQSNSLGRDPITVVKVVAIKLYECLHLASILIFRALLLGAIVYDLSGPRHIPELTRVLLLRLFEHLAERLRKGGKEAEGEAE